MIDRGDSTRSPTTPGGGGSLSENREVDRQLLYGILALHNHFIDRPALVSALRAWLADRSRPMARVLRDLGAVDESVGSLLEALVAHRWKAEGGESPGMIEATRREIEPIADRGLIESLTFMASGLTTAPEDDSLATRLGSDDPDATLPPEAADVGKPAASPWSPASRGRFRVVQYHASGGLGQVSIAIDEELGRQVALKEIQEHHADSAEYRSRFVREAEITGKLEHPGIVPVYGLGQDAAGRPYYAMRFIRGDTLQDAIAHYHRAVDEGAEPGELTVRLRDLLGRFLDVCDAVAYAHSRRVIHRDIKPGNILLGPFGETLVVDWGLAKPLDDPDDLENVGTTSALGPLRTSLGSTGSTPTIAGVAHGTPAYMSPEQAEGRLDLLGPASDVYSLGATLYVLLTGRPPFSGPDTLRRVSVGDFPAPRKILEDVPRPLEAVCLKAMALEPEARYPSAEALAADLKLWLADEPVSAWREPPSIRGRRWMKRHKTAVAAVAASAMIAIVALGSIGLVLAGKNQELLLANRREQQARDVALLARDRAEAAKNQAEAAEGKALASAQAEAAARVAAQEASRRAEVEARTAGRTKDFLVGIFTDSDPLALFAGPGAGSKKLRGTQTAVEILEAGARKVVTDLAGEPLVQASLMDAIGSALRSKAELTQADPLIRKALEIRQSQLPPGDLAIADSLENLGWLLQDQGKTGEALERFQKALEIRKPRLSESDPVIARTLIHIAWVLAEEGRLDEAEPLFRQAVKIREAHPESPRDLTIARLGLAALLVDARRNVEALTWIVSAVKGQFREVGMEGGIQALSQFQQGVAYKNLGWTSMAEKSLKSSLEISSNLLTPGHPYNAFAIFTLAELYNELGQLDEAETYYRRCLDLCRSSVGMGYPRVSYLVSDFAPFLERRGKRAEALALYDEMIEARRRRFAPEHPMIADGLSLQGGFLFKADPARAETLLREALAIYAKHPGSRSVRQVDAEVYLAEILYARRAYDEAEGHYRAILGLVESLPPTYFLDPAMAKGWNLGKLGAVLVHRGKLAEAETALAESLRIYSTDVLPANRSSVYFSLDALAFLRRRQGRPTEAAALTRERRKTCEGNPGLLYLVARDLALCIPMLDPKDGSPNPEQVSLQATYADQVLDILQEAARAGFVDVRRLRSDATFQPLQSRQDFRDLAADLGFPSKPFGP